MTSSRQSMVDDLSQPLDEGIAASRTTDSPFGEVPCNGCTLCCHGDAIRLLPEDNERLYLTVPHARMKGHLMLDHKTNGDCVYLGVSGCTIHDWKPRMCQAMDCRVIAQRITYTQARKTGIVIVWRRGKDLIGGVA